MRSSRLQGCARLTKPAETSEPSIGLHASRLDPRPKGPQYHQVRIQRPRSRENESDLTRNAWRARPRGLTSAGARCTAAPIRALNAGDTRRGGVVCMTEGVVVCMGEDTEREAASREAPIGG